MNQVIPNKDGQLKTHMAEYTKTFVAYDGSGRPLTATVARHDAANGEVAVQTLYIYDGTSTRVAYQLEYEVLWDVTWDLAVFPPQAINIGR